MNRSKPLFISFFFLIADFLALWGIFHLALLLRLLWLGPGVTWANITPTAELGILFCIGVFFLMGLYPGYGLTAVKELERIARAVILAFFLLASVAYLHKPFQIFSRSIILGAGTMAVGILPLLHFALRNLLSRTAWYGEPVVIFGNSPWAEEIAASLRRVRRLGWIPAAIFPLARIDEADIPVENTSMAILALSTNAAPASIARKLNRRFRRVLLLRPQDSLGSLWVEARDLDGYLGLEFTYHLLAWRNRWVKQIIDRVGSALLLLLLSPFLGILALWIILDSPGPILFRQERLGLGFRRFQVLKFRTMVVDAESRLDRLLEEDEEARREYETYHKLKDDPRVTRSGRWLRRFSLDELPQLLNVLRGEMSLVGPRAYMPSELGDMGTYAETILRVLPGMTGWWQVLGRHHTTFEKRLQMDEYYISNWSIWMDIYILLKTVQTVLSGKGA
jgi:Undecaprenyl-phosphate galactose phosphotransferase WbaP